MRASNAFIPTLRQAPKEAEAPSHVLMFRAALARKTAPGLFALLPFGLRAVKNIERIVRDEIERKGGLELSLPLLQPAELARRSGRLETMDPLLLSVRDSLDREFLLGAAWDELIADLASREISSYRDLPRILFHLHTRIENEPRPRLGLIRAIESRCLAAYSLNRDAEELDRSCEAMLKMLGRAFQRCGIDCIIAEAACSTVNDGACRAILAPADAGDIEIAYCETTGFAALRDVCPCLPPGEEDSAQAGQPPPIEKVSTPGASTVEDVCRFLNVQPTQLIKTLIYTAGDEPVVVLVRGDREAGEKKIAAVLGRPVEMAPPEVIERVTGAPVGFAGPVGLKNVRILADPEVLQVQDGVTGANEGDAHLVHVMAGRDFPRPETADLRLAVEGDPCPSGGPGTIRRTWGIELARVEKLGIKLSEVFSALYNDVEGVRRPIAMARCEVSLTRSMAAALEQHHDEKGIVWPVSLAPYDVHVLALGMKDPATREAAEKIVTELEKEGLDVLYDDRDESPGVKFNDADLLGLPVRVIVGKRSLDEGMVELARRDRPREKTKTPIGEVVQAVKASIQSVADRRCE